MVRCALVRVQGRILPTAAREEKIRRIISSSAVVQEGPPVVHPVHRRLEPRRPERVVEVAVIVRAPRQRPGHSYRWTPRFRDPLTVY